MNWMLADLGGTNCRCALTDGETIGAVEEYINRSFDSLESLLVAYRDSTGESLDGFALAVAAPILGDTITMSNIDWSFSGTGLSDALGLDDIVMLNDFEALAHALPSLGRDDVREVGGGNPEQGGALAVLGPGTGLGVAGLLPDDSGVWHAIGGEGGNVTLAAHNSQEALLIDGVRQRHGHCSAEDLVSGRGLSMLYELMYGEAGLSPEKIGQRIDVGNEEALATLEQMFLFMGTVAGNVALTLGATGGVFIGGGIVPRYADRFAMSGFRKRFEDYGRYSGYLKRIPTAIITRPLPAFEGLRNVLAHRSG